MKYVMWWILVLLLVPGVYGAGIYRALLSQTGTAAPSATVLESTFKGTPTFSRFVAGGYLMCLDDAFPDETKIFGLRRPQMLASSSGTTLNFMRVEWDDENDPGSCLIVNTYGVNTQTGQSINADGLLQLTPFEVRVYP